MMLGVKLARFRRMMRGMEMVPMRGMRMMRRLVGIAVLMVLGGVLVMLGRLGVVMGGFFVMLREFVRHGGILLFDLGVTITPGKARSGGLQEVGALVTLK
jgi:hypothetical protein